MENTAKDLFFGIIASFVPIIATSTKYTDRSQKGGIRYIDIVRWSPILLAAINIIGMKIFRKAGIYNLFTIGAILSVVISGFGRFIVNIPTKIFEMKNPNLFHVYALFTWTIFYGIIGTFFYNLC